MALPQVNAVGNGNFSGRAADLTWWNYLKWNVPSCTRSNSKNTVFWTVACESKMTFKLISVFYFDIFKINFR